MGHKLNTHKCMGRVYYAYASFLKQKEANSLLIFVFTASFLIQLTFVPVLT